MISSDFRDRVLRLAAADRAPTRSQVQRATWLCLVASTAISAAIFALAGGLRSSGRPPELIAATATLAAAIAATATWLAVRRGASMIGRPHDVLAGLLVIVPLALIAGKVILSSRFPGMAEAWPDRPGFRCFGLSLGFGAAPLVAYLWIWRQREVPRPGLQGAALGVAAGAFAWTLIDAWCPVAHPAHLALGHLLPLALLAGAGMVWRLVRRP